MERKVPVIACSVVLAAAVARKFFASGRSQNTKRNFSGAAGSAVSKQRAFVLKLCVIASFLARMLDTCRLRSFEELGIG